MAMTHDYMDYLNEKAGICPAGSQEELQAAETIADLMRQHDVEPSIEEFDAKTFGGVVPSALYTLIFLGIVLAGIGVTALTAVGFVLVAAAVALFVLKYLGHDLLANLGPTTRSQNVVAFHQGTGPMVMKGTRPIVIVAHYDSPHENPLYTTPLAPYVPMLWKASKCCTLAVAVCTLFQPLAFLPEPFRRFMWIIGIVAALPLAILGVSTILEHFSDCTDGANDNKSGVAAMLGVLENVRPSGLESAHGAESIEQALEAMREAAEAAAVAAAAEDAGTQPEIPYAGLNDTLADIAPDPQNAPAFTVAPETPAGPAAQVEEVVEEEGEPVVVYKRGHVEGVRHGADVVKSLGMLPEDCEVEYVEPEPVAVTVPGKPRRVVRTVAAGAEAGAAVAAAGAASATAEPSDADFPAPDGFDQAVGLESVDPYGEEDDKPAALESVLSFFRKAKDSVANAAGSIGEKVAAKRDEARSAEAEAETAAEDAAGDQPQPEPEQPFSAPAEDAADELPIAEFEQIDDEPAQDNPFVNTVPEGKLIPFGDEPGEAGSEPEAAEGSAPADADVTASATASFVPAAEKTADVTVPNAVPMSDQASRPSEVTGSINGNQVRFDNLGDGYTISPNDEGLDAENDDELNATAAISPANQAKPAAPDDPEWGKTSFRPSASAVARRATLFDLPDPSSRGTDPFGTDPNAPKVTVQSGAETTASFGGAAAQPQPQAVTAEDEEFAALVGADSKKKGESGEGVLGKIKGMFGTKKTSDAESAPKHGGWKGGAAVRSGLRVVEGDGEGADLGAENAPTEEDLRDEILSLGDDALLCHDIWFVALGASDCDHAGMRAFLAQHRKQIRGSFVINLDSVAAGNLTLLSHEGLLVTRRADRRMLRMMTNVADDLHIPVERVKYDWASTDATPAMLSSLRGLTVMGTDDAGMRALSRTSDDVADNVVPAQAVAVAEAVTELIRRS